MRVNSRPRCDEERCPPSEQPKNLLPPMRRRLISDPLRQQRFPIEEEFAGSLELHYFRGDH
jgi:hypothetical protein